MTKIQKPTPTDAFHSTLHNNRDRWDAVYSRSVQQLGLMLTSAPQVTLAIASEGEPQSARYGLCAEAKGCLSVGLVSTKNERNGALHLWRAQYAPESKGRSAEKKLQLAKATKANDALLTALYTAAAAHNVIRSYSDGGNVVAALALEPREQLIAGQGPQLYVPTQLQLLKSPNHAELHEVNIMLPDPACRKLQPCTLMLRITS